MIGLSALAGGLLSVPAQAVRVLEPPLNPAAGSAGDAIANEGHALSASGRYMVFSSYATNLVADDTNGVRDVFVWNVPDQRVERVGQPGGGQQANGDSVDAVISADGEWIAFTSSASNLTADSNGSVDDVFVVHRRSGVISLVSRATDGQQGLTPAANPDISANGRYVTFDTAGELVAGAGQGVTNVFRRDLWTGVTELISKTPQGAAANGMSMDAQMSASGERIVFVSMATDLVSTATVGKESYLFDARTEQISLLSLTEDGEAGNGISYFPSLSGDGRFAAFHTNATNLAGGEANVTDVVLRDLTTGAFELLSRSSQDVAANNHNTHPALSYRGDRVAFRTDASNLFPDDTGGRGDIVLRDRDLNTTTLVSATSNGDAGNGNSWAPSMALDGASIGFWSQASDLSERGTLFGDALVARIDEEPREISALASAVLPSSRSSQVGSAVTAFASVIASTVSTNCRVTLPDEMPIVLEFQTTDPATNAPVGSANAPFLILPETPQTLVLTLTSSAPLSAEEVELEVACDQGTTAAISGVNTLLFSASQERPADVVALAATQTNDGVVSLPQTGGAAAFAVASVNVGAGGSLTVRARAEGVMLDAITLCATAPSTGACLQSAGTQVSIDIAENDTPTFSVFVSNADEIDFQPAQNRVVIEFTDDLGVVRGRTSVAVRSTE